MKKLFIIACVVFVAACATWTERQKLVFADKAFTVLVEEATFQRQMGNISTEPWVCFKSIANTIDEALNDAWRTNGTGELITQPLREVHAQTRRLQLILDSGESICE